MTETQQRRIAQTTFNETLNGIYISEQTGYQNQCQNSLITYLKKLVNNIESAIIVGDSLTSDILGGYNAQIATCWFNLRGKENQTSIQPDYEIKSLKELIDIVE